MENSVTIVTCYYKIPSKHSHDNYHIWLNDLLLNIKCNIIIFTSLDLVNYFENIKLINTILHLKIIVKEFNEFYIFKKYDKFFWLYQKFIDPTPHVGRSKECYILWNSKMNFVKEAIELNPFNSDKFVWNDIGSMRNKYFSNFLSHYPLYNNISTDKLDIVLLTDYTDKTQIYYQNERHLSGSIFGASKDIFLQIIDLYYKYLDDYINKEYFIGCDQQILSTIYIKHPELFNLINPHVNNMNNEIIDIWFYLYYHYIK